jgi:hypothetical protein
MGLSSRGEWADGCMVFEFVRARGRTRGERMVMKLMR